MEDGSTTVLRDAEAGARVIRGGVARVVAYGASVALAAATSVILLRELGVVAFGVFATVTAIVGVVAGVTDAGLGAVGNRELARVTGRRRVAALEDVVVLRLLLTPTGTVAAAGFALAMGYGSTVVVGVLLAGFGLTLLNVHLTLVQLLAVDLRLTAVAVLEVLRAALTLGAVAAAAALDAGLLWYFAVGIAVGGALLALTPLVVRQARLVRPRPRRSALELLREAAPLAVVVALNVVYFRALVVVTSQVGTPVDAGLYGASFRIVEMLAALPYLLLSTALPILAVDVQSHPERYARVQGRMTEAALIVGLGTAIVTAASAETVVPALGGDEYRAAVDVLRIQAFALVPLFLVTSWTLGAVARGTTRPLVLANAAGLVLVVVVGVALVAAYGAEGAAVAAVGGEVALAALVYAAGAGRGRGAGAASAGRVVRVLAAGVLAAAVAYALPWPLVAAVAAAVVYVVLLLVLRALPPELAEQVRRLARWGRP